MSLAAAGLIAQAGLGLGQTIYGALQKKPEIPQAEIPQELYQNMSDAEYWSLVGMPEEQRQRYLDDMKSTTASSINRTSSRKGGLGIISQLDRNEREGSLQLTDIDTKVRMDNIDKLARRRERLAEERSRVEDVNRNIALDDRDRRDNVIGAGLQNLMGAAGTASMLEALGEGGDGSLKDFFKKLRGNSGSSSSLSLDDLLDSSNSFADKVNKTLPKGF